MSSLWAQLRVAARSLRNAPAFTATVVVTIAAGLGLNTALFTVVDCVLVRPLGYSHADRLVGINTKFLDESRSIQRLGGEDYTDLSHEVKGLEATAWYNSFNDGLQLNGTAWYVPVAMVSPQFTRVLGVEPLAGRGFQASDEQGTDALVSTGFARAHFASAQAALGAPVRFNGSLYTIAGVLPDGFSFPGKTQVWFEFPAALHESRTSYSDNVVGLRRADVTQDELRAELRAFSAQLQRNYPEDAHKALEAEPLAEQLVGTVRPTLELLMGGASLLLLVVCANLAHLQLVRGTRNARAMSVRTALGASRAALAWATLLETALLASAGAVGALLVAAPALSAVRHLAPPDLPRLGDVRINAHVFFFSLAISLFVMAAAALLPLWRSWHVDPAQALRSDAGRASEGRGAKRLREGFLLLEIAFTLTLCAAAVMLGQHLLAEDRQELGFAPNALLTLDTHTVFSLEMPVAKDRSPAELARVNKAEEAVGAVRYAHLQRVLDKVRQSPDVTSADAVSGAPMGYGGTNISYAVRGRQVFAPGATSLPDADVRVITPGFFRTLGVPHLAGRVFSTADRADTQRVTVINQALAHASFPGEDPIGKQIVCGYDSDLEHGTWTIVGVVGDVRGENPALAPRPAFYVPVTQHPFVDPMQVVVRTSGDPRALSEELRREVSAAFPDTAVEARTMREDVQGSERPERFRSALFFSFAMVSIMLAAVGTYGVTAYTVEQRRFEFAVRLALGAGRARVLSAVLAAAARTALGGVVVGVALSLAAARVLGSVVGPLVVGTFAGYAFAAGVVVLLVILASCIPAGRAAATQPMEALRAE